MPAKGQQTAPDTLTITDFQDILRHQLSLSSGSKVVVAFSGGLDSHVLLHILSRIATDYPISLSAIHIDHCLQEESGQWAAHCQQVCDGLDVPLVIRRVDIIQQRGMSLEAQARDARYAAIADELPAGGVCMTAQHLDDQSETVLLQLLRGAGVHGLAAMPMDKPFNNGKLMRPLLNYSRKALQQYAGQHDLQWVEDPSNRDNRFDRNYLRNVVIPLLQKRWPGFNRSLSRSSRHAASARLLIDEQASSDLQSCFVVSNEFTLPAIAYLDMNSLRKLSPVHQQNTLRYWVRMHELPMPGDDRLQTLLGLIEKSSPSGSIDWQGGAFCLDGDTLWLCTEPVGDVPAPVDCDWDLSGELLIQGTQLQLSAIARADEGLSARAIGDTGVQVRFRRGQEVCRMSGEHGTKALKKVLQDLAVPPWQRKLMPLIYLDDELVAIPAVWTNPHYLPAKGEKGYLFSLATSVAAGS